MAHSFTELLYHIVFSTKERVPSLDETVRPRLFEYLGGAIRGEGGTAIIVNGMPDHVHVLARLRADRAVSDVLRNIKANSSGWLHDEFPALASFAWQAGYGAFTVSRSQAERVERYIARQEEHHRRITFQEEFKKLLKAHGIAFDERYLWR